MTTVKSINLYVRSEKTQKERYDKLQERMQKPKRSADKQTEEVVDDQQLEFKFDK